tara:strand:- start:716 stop:1078 length:363 start_codon:yes stop_codon:yes gene_type:complete
MEFKKELKEKLEEYVEKTNSYNDLSEQLNDFKSEKQDLEEEIIKLMQRNKMDHKIFVLNDYKIQHKTIYQYQNVSLKLIESSLREYCEMHSISINIDEYLSYIKDKRDKKQKDELKIQSI